MKQSVRNSLILCGLILTGAFGLMEGIDHQWIRALLWLCAAAVFASLWLNRKKEVPEKDRLDSMLDEETRKAMLLEPLTEIQSDSVQVPKGEKLYWADQARQDYYNGHQDVMFLTGKRLGFQAEEFSFDLPIEQMKITPTKNGFEVSLNGRSMRFVSASTPELLKTWAKLKQTGSVKSS